MQLLFLIVPVLTLLKVGLVKFLLFAFLENAAAAPHPPPPHPSPPPNLKEAKTGRVVE